MTITPILDTRYKPNEKGRAYPVGVRLKHQKQDRIIPTGFKVEIQFWKGEQVVKHPDAAIINNKIAEIVSQAKRYLADCTLNNRKIDLSLVGKVRNSHSFTEYLEHRARQYGAKSPVMVRKLKTYANDLRAWSGGEVYFSDLTHDTLREFENYLIEKKNVANTRQKKFAWLGQFYNNAITDGKAQDPNPFKTYKIPKTPVKKEKLSEVELKALENLHLVGPVRTARDLFLFSYYCKGMRFENCVTLRRENIINGRIYFTSNKGKDHISVAIHSRLEKLLSVYPGEFIFPYVKAIPEGKEAYVKMIDSLNVIVNRNLKVAVKLAGIKKNISFHCARHTFAFHLKKNTDSIHVIKESLGHSDTRITEMYLKALDDEALDKDLRKLYGD